MINKLICIANYLRTSYKGKGHGGYNIYKDDKIIIQYDTYYPNVDVSIKINDKWEQVLNHSGHGINYQHRSGKWEEYVSDILYPKAVEARRLSDLKDKQRKEEEKQKNFGSIDDSAVFES
ncbi:MAG: hypothetical protein Q7R95_10700 [bacterium]|nr:hypothetical protein [bacterium]